MDMKGIAAFLVLAFGLAFAAEAALLASDWINFENREARGPVSIHLLYFIPGIAAFLAHRFVSKTPPIAGTLWPLNWVHVALAVVGVGAVSSIGIGLQILLGVIEPDWELTRLTSLFEDNNLTMTAPTPWVLITSTAITALLGIVMYGPLCLAAEYGWRGYFLPRLMPMGKVRAYVVVGLFWGLWFTPIIFTRAMGTAVPFSTLARVLIMALVLSFILGEIYARSNSLSLCAIIAGSFTAQLSGIEIYLFPVPDPPWAHSFGYVSLGVWILAAAVVWFWPRKAGEVQHSTA